MMSLVQEQMADFVGHHGSEDGRLRDDIAALKIDGAVKEYRGNGIEATCE